MITKVNQSQPITHNQNSNTSFDRQMLYDEIRNRLGHQDILDLIFDLELNENDVIGLNPDMHQVIHNIINYAEQTEQTGTLTLAVERILTPVPRDHLPRLEKLTPDSHPTVLRQYLLAHYIQQDLADMAQQLQIDWEELGGGGKKEMVRQFLLYLYRRNRIHELLDLMQTAVEEKSSVSSEQ